MKAICVCGKEFKTKPCLVAIGKGKFCSKKCSYANKTRRSGLKYNIKVKNKAWFQEGVVPKTAWKPGETAGENNPNWKGGISSQVSPSKKEKQNLSTKIKKWKKQIFKRDGRICSICKSTEQLEVDHIKPWSTHPDLRFELSNGRVLCNQCHRKTDSYGVRP